MKKTKLATERNKLVMEGPKPAAGLLKPEASHGKLALERRKLVMARLKLARRGHCALPRQPKPGKRRREPSPSAAKKSWPRPPQLQSCDEDLATGMELYQVRFRLVRQSSVPSSDRRTPLLRRQGKTFIRRASASLRQWRAGMPWRLASARREEAIIEITDPAHQLLAERLRPPSERASRLAIEDKVKRPLTEELLFGVLENGGQQRWMWRRGRW